MLKEVFIAWAGVLTAPLHCLVDSLGETSNPSASEKLPSCIEPRYSLQCSEELKTVHIFKNIWNGNPETDSKTPNQL